MTASLFDHPVGPATAPAQRRSEASPDRLAAGLEIGRSRLVVSACVFALGFLTVAARLVEVSLIDATAAGRPTAIEAETIATTRADITDRNGSLLATSLPAVSLVANPREIDDPVGAAMALAGALESADPDELLAALSADSSYVSLQRPLTPAEQYAVNRLGILGVRFEQEPQRYYPAGRLTSHILGFTTMDRHQDGLAGLERALDDRLTATGEALALTIDLRAQEILIEELAAQGEAYQASGAAGVILDAETAEIVALASWPDFDPYTRQGESALFNRATQGVYEMGSGFKLFTIATALEAGTATLTSTFDARYPLQVVNDEISDYHPQYRVLSLPEVFIHSSNIGAARMALDFGAEVQQLYLDRLGLLDPAPIEHNEVGAPLLQPRWNETETATIAFGHGISVGVVPMAAAIRATVVDGAYLPPTLVAGTERQAEPVFSPETVDAMRRLMRLNVADPNGSGGAADVPGYLVGGKTGTADEAGAGGYGDNLRASFAAVFPMNRPEFVIFVMFDRPQEQEPGLRPTGGRVAAPTVARIIERLGPVMGLVPVGGDDPTIGEQLGIEIDGRLPPMADARP
jgi:cell division protein FtsI (penicillin-binding protein 3)